MVTERENSPGELSNFQQEIEVRKKQIPIDGTLIQVDTTRLNSNDFELWERLKKIAKKTDTRLLVDQEMLKTLIDDFKDLVSDNRKAIKSKNVLGDKLFNSWLNNKIGAISTNLEIAEMDDEPEDSKKGALVDAVVYATMLEMNHSAGMKLLKRQLKGEQLNEEIKRVNIKALNPEKLELLDDFFSFIESIKVELSKEDIDEQAMGNIVKKMDQFSVVIGGQGVAERCRDVVDMIRNQLLTLNGKIELLLNPKAKPEMKQRMIEGILTNINRWE